MYSFRFSNCAAWLRGRAGIPIVAGVMTILLLSAFHFTAPAGAIAPLQASVVVQVDDQAQLIREIAFTEAISGLKALEVTGLDVVTQSFSFGDAVCSIAGVGCPAEDCFCSTNYWSYWYWDDVAGWQGYPVGAGNSVISQTGAIEGWRWGEFGDTLRPVTATLQAAAALPWLAARQTITGDLGSVGATVESVLAFGANQQQNPSAHAYLAATGAGYARISASAAGKLAVALSAADACLPSGAPTPSTYFSPTLGAYSTQSGVNTWAILGTVALSETAPAAAIDYLAAQIQPDGGWEWAPGWGSDTNATALTIQALIAAGESITSTAVISGLAYLDATQNSDGGFPYAADSSGALSDANSTAYAIQALFAAGEDPYAPRWTGSGGSPFDYLTTMQLADGSFAWQLGAGANQLATQQVIPALLGQTYPLDRRTLASCPGIYLPLVQN
ncbi:prenyltransferase/squalene oxidase repeat-containing protein [Caldilinea sp.]|uniref:prenyltransferase/squalene oxidase repeat-containing protein n=1 Tax=Caldilinea sp. TaxID=2293560 RepID=UPI002C29BA7D|nr:terpene cyclase/mutase family protein [Anaerolineales bacterium]HQY92347.1 terpene cyclase/mutase family protein [Caldilinea sp.]HRA67870.1 terpene cyclase/mutase family protein [Caldilinea sp.]